jgi:hypothetical protein
MPSPFVVAPGLPLEECRRLYLEKTTCVSTAKQYCQHFILPASRFRNVQHFDSETRPVLNTNRGAMIEWNCLFMRLITQQLKGQLECKYKQKEKSVQNTYIHTYKQNTERADIHHLDHSSSINDDDDTTTTIKDRLCGLSGQRSWLQIQRSRFDSRRYQIFWQVVDLERGPLSLVSTIEELLGRNSSGFGLEIENTAVGIRRADCATPIYPQKFAKSPPPSPVPVG